MSDQYDQRLRSEAEFQDRRVRASHEGQDEVRGKFYFLAARAMDEYDAALGDLAGRRVLTVGCSEGGVLPLARRGARVTGIDISPEAISRLSETIKQAGLEDRADAVVMDAMDPTFPDGTFDLICCTGVLHHLDTARSAVAWGRILRPDGRVVMFEPMAWHPAVALFRLLTPKMRTPDEHPIKPRDIALLRESFGRVEVSAHVLTSILALFWLAFPNAAEGRRKTVDLLGRVDDGILRLFPALKYMCWTSVIQLSDPRPAQVARS